MSEEETGYKAELDVVLCDLGEIPGTTPQLYAAIRSYNGGPEKLSVYKKVGQKKPKQVQIFRLPMGQFQAIASHVHELNELMERVNE